jgi:hypothetical protein
MNLNLRPVGTSRPIGWGFQKLEDTYYGTDKPWSGGFNNVLYFSAEIMGLLLGPDTHIRIRFSEMPAPCGTVFANNFYESVPYTVGN